MLFDILKPKLPLIVYSLGIAVAVALVRNQTRTQQLDISETVKLTLLIFATLNVLSNYAPKVFQTTTQGMGIHTGIYMIGGGRTEELGPHSKKEK